MTILPQKDIPRGWTLEQILSNNKTEEGLLYKEHWREKYEGKCGADVSEKDKQDKEA